METEPDNHGDEVTGRSSNTRVVNCPHCALIMRIEPNWNTYMITCGSCGNTFRPE